MHRHMVRTVLGSSPVDVGVLLGAQQRADGGQLLVQVDLRQEDGGCLGHRVLQLLLRTGLVLGLDGLLGSLALGQEVGWNLVTSA